MGCRLQLYPHAEPSEILLHVRMFDQSADAQQDAVVCAPLPPFVNSPDDPKHTPAGPLVWEQLECRVGKSLSRANLGLIITCGLKQANLH